MKINHQHFETLNSTQSYLKEALKNKSFLDSVFLVSAEGQSEGYGRLGKKWNSDHRGIFMSFSMKPHEILTLTSLEMAILISDFFHKKYQLVVDLKWPNDLIYNNGKCGGILLQTFENQVIVGIGVNLEDSQDTLSSESFDIKPSSLPITQVSSKEICFELCSFICSSRLSSLEILNRFRDRCVHINKSCKITQGDDIFEGIFIGCGDNGEAIMQVKEGEKKSFFSGTLRYF